MGSAPVIYFDGVCNLCSGAVQFILKHDKKNIFRFASLQGAAGQSMLAENNFPADHFKTFILEENGRIFTRSTAALRIAKLLGGPWSFLYGFIIVPPFFRDSIYNLISKNRYTWFGRKEACWLPTPEWQHRFLE
ncbi:MAG TPA: thiol-disulfide oxidoreductase DCC family protein [Chitinophagaceae bacterium]|nr:thiol-disulfide oxidoreductase DCC family protein [Chitinophagaceae bacterium]